MERYTTGLTPLNLRHPVAPLPLEVGKMAKSDKKTEQLLGRAREHFNEGEQPLQVIRGDYESKMPGNYNYRKGILVATDQRVLFYGKKRTGFMFEALPYGNISSVQTEKGRWLLGGQRQTVTFFTSGDGSKIMEIFAGDMRAFVDTVNARMAAAKSGAESASERPIDPVGQLERLGKLHAAGVLTDEEFSAKKAEMLAQI